MSLTGNKDTDRMVLGNLTDRDVLNCCLVTRACNEEFWRNRFARKYKIDNLKELPKDYTWKKLCLTSYLTVFEEAFQDRKTDLLKILIQDIPEFEMEGLLKKEMIPEVDVQDYVFQAAKVGYIDFIAMVFDTIKFDPDDLIDIFRTLEHENTEIFVILRKAGLPVEMFDLVYAIERGQYDLAKLILYSEAKEEIIKDSDRVYEAALEKQDQGELIYFKMLLSSYLTPSPLVLSVIEKRNIIFSEECVSCREEVEDIYKCKICDSDVCEACLQERNILTLTEGLSNCPNKCENCQRIGCQECISTCYQCWNIGESHDFICQDCSNLQTQDCSYHSWDLCPLHVGDECVICIANKNYSRYDS